MSAICSLHPKASLPVAHFALLNYQPPCVEVGMFISNHPLGTCILCTGRSNQEYQVHVAYSSPSATFRSFKQNAFPIFGWQVGGHDTSLVVVVQMHEGLPAVCNLSRASLGSGSTCNSVHSICLTHMSLRYYNEIILTSLPP